MTAEKSPPLKKKKPLSKRLSAWVKTKSPWILHFGSGGCLQKDTEIVVGNGIVGIGDLIDSFGKRRITDNEAIESMAVEGKTQSFGDFSPKEKELYAIHRLKSKDGFVKITTTSGVPVVLTPDHKVLVDTIEGPKWVETRELKPRDYLYSPRKIKIEGKIPDINAVLPSRYVNYRKQKPKLTREFMYILGLVASDGYVSFSSKKNHATYKISFCNKEKKLLNLFESGIKEFSPLSKVCRDRATNSGTPIRCAYSPVLFHIAKHFGLHKSKDIKNVFSLPEDYIASFLAGYFDGDGHISIYCRERENPRVEIGIVTNHFLTAKRLFLLFKRLGIASKIAKSMNNSTFGSKLMYRVTISDQSDIRKFIDTIPIKHPFKMRRAIEAKKITERKTKTMASYSMAPLLCNSTLKDMRINKGLKQHELYNATMVSEMENGGRITRYTANNMLSNLGALNGMKVKFETLLSNEYYLDPISKIEPIKGNETVYNISVKETEAYVPEGAFVVKNCNGCILPVVAAISPRNDIERFGCVVKGSPRHADILLVEGPVTRKVLPRLKTIYNQIPEPKVVVGIGACTISKGIFKDCYNVCGPLDKVMPVDVYVPGCPPRPEAIIQGLLKALEKFEDK